MSTKSKNANLLSARRAKKDEFYTQLSDIEKELRHYKEHFKGKTVYCNCDDPRVSNFFHYFSHQFEALGLKKLITTCYKSQDVDLFSQSSSEQAIYLEYEGDKNGNKIPDLDEIGVKTLKGDGDFRSQESIELLKTADIVVTTPPFSLFREYVRQLIHYDKKFLIIGNDNAVTYKEIFALIQSNKVWLGNCRVKEFLRPNKSVMKFGNVGWYTNLSQKKRDENLILYRHYSPANYQNYDNYDAIEVAKVKDIPCDWDGLMGVPITFLDKYNPEQFNIIGIAETWYGAAIKTYPTQIQIDKNGDKKEVSKLNDAPAIKVVVPPKNKTYYMVNGASYVATYVRLLVRIKKS